jgi:hypothetical protein
MLKLLEQLIKTNLSIEGAFPLKYALVKPLQAKNACSPMLVTLAGMVTLVKPLQTSNALSPILVTLLGMVTLVI